MSEHRQDPGQPPDPPGCLDLSRLPAYLTEREAAALVRRSARTLQGWRLRRRGPPWVKQGDTKFAAVAYPADVLAWMRARVRGQ